MKPRTIFSTALFALLAAHHGAAANITWDGNGDSSASGNWSTGLNWDSNTDPGPGAADTAILPDVATGTRVISFDAAATSPVQALQFDQSTASATNQLDFLRDATITNAITLGSSAGTEEIRLSPPTTGNRNLTAPGAITLNTGGLLTMGANFEGTTQRTSTVTGSVTISGGTLYVTPSGLLSSANSRNVTGSLTMTSGTLSIDSASAPSAAQSRLQATGINITGGDINRGTGTAGQSQLVTNGPTNTLSPTTFDKGVSVSLLSGNQTITIGTPIGELVNRNTGAASTTTTKTLTMSGTGSTGKLSFGVAGANSVSNVVLGSSLSVTNDPASGSMPTGTFGSAGNPVSYGIDTAGFTLDLTAARAGGGSITWTPNVQGGGTNWNLINSGTALQGGIKVGNVNFSTATQVNVGPGVAIEITGGSNTAINAGGGGTWDSETLLTYSGASASATPATLTTNRTIGDLLLSGTGSLQLLASSSANAYQNDITIRRGTLIVGADGLLGGGSATPIKLGDGNSVTDSRIALHFGNGITIDRPIDASAPLGTGANPSSQRPRILLTGIASTGTVSADITHGLAGAGTAQIFELSAPDVDSVLTVSGLIKKPVGQTAAGRVLINGGNSGKGTIKLTNSGNDFTAGITVVDGCLLIPASIPATGNSVIGTNGTLNIADGGSPEATTISVLLDGALSFDRATSLNRNTTATGTQYTAVLGMAATGSGAATWSGNIGSSADIVVKTLRLTAPAGASVLFSGTIGANADATGAVLLDKAGEGIVELTGANTYDGATTVSEGTLLANNTTGSATSTGAVTVNAGAILGGSGTAAGPLTVNGIVAPGNSTGTLNCGAATFEIGSELNIEINDAATPKNDTLAVNGALVLNGGALNLAVTGTPAQNAYVLISYTGTPPTGTFASVPPLPSGYVLDYDYAGNSVALVKTGSDPYTGWINGYPSITGGDRSPDADPDGDGVENGIEFMTGTIPSNPGSRNAPSITRNGSGDLEVIFQRVDDAEAYSLAVEHSTTLQAPWAQIAVPNNAITGPPVTVVDNGSSADSITVIVAAAGDPRKFARVKLTIPFTP